MTGNRDQTETLIERTLARRAEQAPSDDHLLTRVHARLRRRRVTRRTGAALVAATAVAAGIAGVNVLTAGNPGTPAAPSESTTVAGAPDGWRWESYRFVEVQVPDTWGYGTTGWPHCLDKTPRPPYVGRPGYVPMIGCNPKAKEPAYVWFGDGGKAGVRQRDNGWVEETRTMAGMSVTVFSDDADLRRRVLESIRPISETDAHGCPVKLPDTVRPGHRPANAGGLESVGTVRSVTMCKYMSDWSPPLIAGSTIDTEAAGRVVNAILAAPPGSGPHEPAGSCMAGDESEMMLLKVRGTERDQDVTLRYFGCGNTGTDDGKTLRQLTREVAAPILTGVFTPTGARGPVLDKILPPR